LYRIMTNSLYSHRKSSIVYKHLSKWQPYNISVPLDLKVTCDTRLIQNIIYVWKLNQTVLELDFWAVKFLFFPRRDLNSHIYMTVDILLTCGEHLHDLIKKGGGGAHTTSWTVMYLCGRVSSFGIAQTVWYFFSFFFPPFYCRTNIDNRE
jgi:hypothetical protein